MTYRPGKWLACVPLNIVLSGSLLAIPAVAQQDSQITESKVVKAREVAYKYEEPVIVIGRRVVARNRIDSIQSLLSYDIEFFQRFEPNSLQDMLKRIPGLTLDSIFQSTGVASSSEALSVGFRGLFGEGAGQILLNGRRIPGINPANLLAFSSIPAELVAEIQVFRSVTAQVDSQGLGLTVNVVLKDGSDIPQGYDASWRALLRSIGGNTGGDFSGSYRAELPENTDFSISMSYSDRPSETGTEIVETSTTNTTSLELNDLAQIDQTQFGLNSTLVKPLSNASEISAHAYWFYKDSSDTVRRGVTDPSGTSTFVLAGEEDSGNFGTAIKYLRPFGGGGNSFSLGLSYDQSDIDTRAGAAPGETLTIATLNTSQDRSELKFDVSANFFMGDIHDVIIGAHVEQSGQDNSWQQSFTGAPASAATAYTSELEQSRLDFFAVYEIDFTDTFTLGLGYRYETSDDDWESTTFEPIQGLAGVNFDQAISSSSSNSSHIPSMNIKWALHENQDLRVSVGKNVSRPSAYRQTNTVSPVAAPIVQYNVALNQLNAGNPNLENIEGSYAELDYDYHFADGDGIVGVAVYYKKIEDNLPIERVEGATAVNQYITASRPELLGSLNSLAAVNIVPERFAFFTNGSQSYNVKGLDFDFSIPMKLIGLPDLSFSSNTSYYTKTFSDTVNQEVDSLTANFTIDHRIRHDITYGLSYNVKTDEDDEYFTTTDVSASGQVERDQFRRDPSLDIFVEKRFGDNFIARFSIENATDAKDQVERAFYLSGTPDTRDVSVVTSESDRQFLLVLRGSF